MKKTNVYMALGGALLGGACYAMLNKKAKSKSKALKELL